MAPFLSLYMYPLYILRLRSTGTVNLLPMAHCLDQISVGASRPYFSAITPPEEDDPAPPGDLHPSVKHLQCAGYFLEGRDNLVDSSLRTKQNINPSHARISLPLISFWATNRNESQINRSLNGSSFLSASSMRELNMNRSTDWTLNPRNLLLFSPQSSTNKPSQLI